MATFYNRTVTVIDLIKRAYRLMGVYSIGETPTADESVDGLTGLNAMLGDWANEGLTVYALTTDSIPLTTGVATYTIGATGGFSTNRPAQITDASYIVFNNVSFPLKMYTLAQYNNIAVKADQGIPAIIQYTPDFPNGTITLYPVPQASMTLNLVSTKLLNVFQNLTDIVAFPPGYENAIVFNLARHLSAEFGNPLSMEVVKTAQNSKKAIKRTNTIVPILKMPYGITRTI